MIKFIILYSELISFFQATVRSVKKLHPNMEIVVIYWDRKRLSKYEIRRQQGVKYFPRSKFSTRDLYRVLSTEKPDIIYMSGWMDYGYMFSTAKYKLLNNKNVKVIAGIDDQWHGTLKQKFGSLLFPITLSYLYDYMWVAGKPQYHYARKIGYPGSKIVGNLLSADTDLFYNKSKIIKRFVYLGRFSKEKGILDLVRAYQKLPVDLKYKWPLVMIGDGPLYSYISDICDENIQLKGFLQDTDLRVELEKGGIYISPSIRDQWGVSIHEMALLGYPLILSDSCGAATEFLIHGYNGFLFETNNIEDLSSKMIDIINLGSKDLDKFKSRSVTLGRRINSEISAASLLSIIK